MNNYGSFSWNELTQTPMKNWLATGQNTYYAVALKMAINSVYGLTSKRDAVDALSYAAWDSQVTNDFIKAVKEDTKERINSYKEDTNMPVKNNYPMHSVEFCYNGEPISEVKELKINDSGAHAFVNLATTLSGTFSYDYEATFTPKKIIYSGPKTIVLWKDGTKTIVSLSEGDTWDAYSGFCAALMKKIFGSTNHAKTVMRKHSNVSELEGKHEVAEWYKSNHMTKDALAQIMDSIGTTFTDGIKSAERFIDQVSKSNEKENKNGSV